MFAKRYRTVPQNAPNVNADATNRLSSSGMGTSSSYGSGPSSSLLETGASSAALTTTSAGETTFTTSAGPSTLETGPTSEAYTATSATSGMLTAWVVDGGGEARWQ